MTCQACGMHTEVPEFHPYLACIAMKYARDSNSVRANLRWVVEYGMKAERAGVSLDEAMKNIAAIREETP